jgi:hypothetical protein
MRTKHSRKGKAEMVVKKVTGSSLFAKGLGDNGIQMDSGVGDAAGQSDLNAKITAVATAPGVPVDNGPSGS